MKQLITGALTALTLATALSAGTTAAQADDWHGRGYGRGSYDHGRGPGVGAVVGAGILGLAVGAAVAGRDRHHYDGPPPVYYRAPPPAYYSGDDYYGYADACRVYWRWDPYWRRYVEVERCY